MTSPSLPGTHEPRQSPSHTPPVTPEAATPPTVPAIVEQLSTLQRNVDRAENANARLSHELGEARARIDALERYNVAIAARRREAVAQFLNMRPLYYESANTFDARARDIQSDDLESMLCLYSSTVMTVVNAQQRAIALLNQQLYELGLAATRYGQVPHFQSSLATHTPIGPDTTPIGYAYPVGYMQNGYCRAHLGAYPCRICGR
ncbi:hypothetical protein NX059_000379 [Plenodomus lindquistii]|nr:hypothetical protein NX059_000379 [Plenodomus lindquistii]